MNLGFKQLFANGQPTLFIEKIWMGLAYQFATAGNGSMFDEYRKYADAYREKFGNNWGGFPHLSLDSASQNMNAKFHSIRPDTSDSWEAGKDIHFVINNRQPMRFQFAPVVKVESVQTIEIERKDGLTLAENEGIRTSIKVQDVEFTKQYIVRVDGVSLDKFKIRSLVVNDGFSPADVAPFFDFFGDEFTGKIIHWTGLRY